MNKFDIRTKINILKMGISTLEAMFNEYVEEHEPHDTVELKETVELNDDVQNARNEFNQTSYKYGMAMGNAGQVMKIESHQVYAYPHASLKGDGTDNPVQEVQYNNVEYHNYEKFLRGWINFYQAIGASITQPDKDRLYAYQIELERVLLANDEVPPAIQE